MSLMILMNNWVHWEYKSIILILILVWFLKPGFDKRKKNYLEKAQWKKPRFYNDTFFVRHIFLKILYDAIFN